MGPDGSKRNPGDHIKLKISDHPVLRNMLDDPSDEIVFEQATNFVAGGSEYIGYKPIIINGKVRAVLGLSYDWSEMRRSMLKTVRSTFLIGLGAMAAAMVILLWMLNRKAVSPVKRIQKGVCEYIENKDSAAVISEMTKIKERNEFGLLSENISELANSIDRYTNEIVTLTGEKERVKAELDMAKNIQAGQLPSVFPAFPERMEFDMFASMTPAKEVGGDFYDFFLIDDDHLALVIADVSGKGVPAALFMMMSKMLISNFTGMGLSPAKVLTRTNKTICKNNKEKMFDTVWLGILEISTGRVTAANAGHEYPMIRQPDGDIGMFRDKHGFVIGGFKGKKYKQYEFTLGKGGTLFVYTIETVHGDVDSFVGTDAQFDDLTMLAVKLKN